MSTIKDAYPSRVRSSPEWLPRLDPVVYTSMEQPEGPLARQQLEDYHKNGFLFFPGLFDAGEVAALSEEMRRLGHDPAALNREGSITEPDSGDLRTLFEIHKTSAVFARLARDARLAGIAQQLLGDEIYVSQSRLNYKPGFRAKEFYWHSDFESWHVEDGMPRMRALSISVTLTDNFETNGPLMVIPGSHRTFVACVGETPDDNYKTSLKRQDIGVPALVVCFFLIVAGGGAIQYLAWRGKDAPATRGDFGKLELLPRRPGMLRVVADPWAHVFVDGQRVDTTPFARPIPLQAGVHYVKLEHPQAPTERRTVRIVPGETVLLDVKMKLYAPPAPDAAGELDEPIEADAGPDAPYSP